MLGIDLGERPGAASQLMRRLLQAGYITSTGGGQREVLVLTPALNIDESMGGNLCRCATYVRIREAIKSAARQVK